MTLTDREAVERQLGRELRGQADVAHRCDCGQPDVVRTHPLLPDGSPFPTLYYLTCPRLAAAIGTLEADGVMRELQHQLETNVELAQNYQSAHERYLRERDALAVVDQISGISAGGMPTRVKCLHVLAAQALASGAGVNVLGDQVLERATAILRGPLCSESLEHAT